MSDRRGRQTRQAESSARRGWYGHGESVSIEKSGFGRFLDDLAYVFADVSVTGLPALWYVLLSPDVRAFGPKTTTLLAWTAMVLTGAVIRGGWVRPPWTDVRGWVSLRSWLVLFRLCYYNPVLLVAAYGGGVLAGTAYGRVAPVGFALGLGVLAAAAFPRLGEAFYRRVAGE